MTSPTKKKKQSKHILNNPNPKRISKHVNTTKNQLTSLVPVGDISRDLGVSSSIIDICSMSSFDFSFDLTFFSVVLFADDELEAPYGDSQVGQPSLSVALTFL